MTTPLRYLDEMHVLEGSAKVIAAGREEDRSWLELEATHFHPQGGGQPADHGFIEVEGSRFDVVDVRMVEGRVRHYGSWSTEMADPVTRMARYSVDSERRRLLSRIHSGGHVIDMAIHELGLGWTPGKGYHFPDSPYVEYEGDPGEEREALIRSIEEHAAGIIARDLQTSVTRVDAERLAEVVAHVPQGAPASGSVRVVNYGAFGVPCGGTHVAALSEIGRIDVRKIKPRKGMIRVSYDVDRSR